MGNSRNLILPPLWKVNSSAYFIAANIAPFIVNHMLQLMRFQPKTDLEGVL